MRKGNHVDFEGYFAGKWGGKGQRKRTGVKFVGSAKGLVPLGNIARLGLSGADFGVFQKTNKRNEKPAVIK